MRWPVIVLVSLGSACGSSAPPPSPPSRPIEEAPALDVPALAGGGRVTIASSKVTVVVFWATWCTACKEAFPRLEALRTKYAARGLEVIAISVDEDRDAARSYVARARLTLTSGWDEQKRATGAWRLTSTPALFLVDRTGLIRSAHMGFGNDVAEKIEGEVVPLLAE
jgi:thiol-disulfide isomerase/thioredoxin